MPIRLSVVSATNRLDVPAAFWIWKAVVELEAFCCLRVPVKVLLPVKLWLPLSLARLPESDRLDELIWLPLTLNCPVVLMLPAASMLASTVPPLFLNCNRSAVWLVAPWIIPPTLADEADWILKLAVVCRPVPFWIELGLEQIGGV